METYDAKLYKPEIATEGTYKGISDPVEAIDDDGILHHVFWDGKMWHEIVDGCEETFNAGLKEWRKLPKSWIYDSEFYSITESVEHRESRKEIPCS